MNSLRRYMKIVCLVIVLLPAMTGKVFADYDYIVVTDPFQKEIPMAIPVPVSLSDNDQTDLLAEQVADFLARSLDFTGYFNIIDRRAFLDAPGEQGLTAREVNFQNWRTIGAELLITAGVRFDGRVLQLEFRLFDPFRQELLFGKRYTGETADLREIVLRFCDEMLYRLTGDFGVFNTKIAFVSETDSGKALFISDFDGENVRRLTDKDNIVVSPAWSADGRRLAYTSYKNDRPEIFIRSMDTGEETLLSSYDGLNITPAWKPGGSKMAATLSFEGDEEIYLLTGSGKVDKRLTSSWGVDVSPSFSPDGKKMAFVSGRAGSPQIYIMDLETGRTNRLTFEGRYNTQPQWSPNGDRIAYSGMKDGSSDIYLIKPDGSGLVQLTRDAGRNESPSWSPDGNMIVFSSTRKGASDIYAMTSSGANQRRIIELEGNQSLPAWSPTLKP